MATLISESLTDINHLSDILVPSASIPNTDIDRITQLINGASQHLLTFTQRPSLKYYSIASELHDGDGTEWIRTRYWPIIAVTEVNDDSNRTYGSGTIVPTTDYEIYRNNTNSWVCNPGIIRHLNGTFVKDKSNVKVIYTAGYSGYEIQEGYNDQIVVNEGTSNITVTFTAGRYNAASLATHIGTAMTTDATTTLTYTCTYSSTSHRFKISGSANYSIRWLASGLTRHKEFGKLIGFNTLTDEPTAASHTGDYPALGLPEDIVEAATDLVRWVYEETKEKRIGKFSENKGDSSYSYDYSNMPNRIVEMIRPYIMWSV